jgi:hypothetical protein
MDEENDWDSDSTAAELLLLLLQDFLVDSSGEQDSRVQRERVVSCQKYPSAMPSLAKCRVVGV